MPSGPESLISISPICQTAASDALTTPGTSAFAEVLAPQVLPMLRSAVGMQSSGIGKAMSWTVAGVFPWGPLSWSVMRIPLTPVAPGKLANSVRSEPARQSEALEALGKQGG